MNNTNRNRQLAETQRQQRIIDLWLQRPRAARTAEDVFAFYGWLTEHAPALLPAGAGPCRQLTQILSAHVVDPAPPTIGRRQ